VKGSIVAQDPTEQGIRRALNLGHTLGHALESFFLHQGTPILHGQAVALGLLAEAHLAHGQGVCSEPLLLEIEETILSQYPLLPIERSDISALVRLLRHDKKRVAGAHRYVALAAPGQYDVNAAFTDAEARKAFATLL
jgi:3-dehydroquinate synthase